MSFVRLTAKFPGKALVMVLLLAPALMWAQENKNKSKNAPASKPAPAQHTAPSRQAAPSRPATSSR
ncbi:MAG: hypothetical protein WA188_16100, partial [Terriglobales bacterium]